MLLQDISFRTTGLLLPILLLVLSFPANPQGTIIQVPQTLATPCEAVASATLGDRIEIDAAYLYPLEACTINKNNLTIVGVNGRAVLNGNVELSGDTSFWMVTGDNIVVENIEFSNARNSMGEAIALFVEGTNPTVRDCRFTNNDNGLAVADNQLSDVLVERSEFGGNGVINLSPNVYVGHVNRFTFQFNYSHHALYGDLVTSRAAENFILYNRLTEEDGVSRHQINIPNGGLTYIIGNIIQTGNTQERNLVAYCLEGSDPRNPSEELLVVNNTFVNDTYFSMNFIAVDGSVQSPSFVWNNIFSGDGVFVTQSNTNKLGSVHLGLDFVDPSNFDYRLQSTSSAIDAGYEPGYYAGFDLTPHYHYVHPTSSEARTTVDLIDAGAWEFGGTAGGSSPQPPTMATPKKVLLSAKSMFVQETLSGNRVILNQVAEEDVIVILESENPQLADVTPSSVRVQVGFSESEPFSISAGNGIKHPTQVKISATAGGVAKRTGIRVKPIKQNNK